MSADSGYSSAPGVFDVKAVVPLNVFVSVEQLQVLADALSKGLRTVFEEVELTVCPRSIDSSGAPCTCPGADGPVTAPFLGYSQADRVLVDLGHATDSVNCSKNRGDLFELPLVLDKALGAAAWSFADPSSGGITVTG